MSLATQIALKLLKLHLLTNQLIKQIVRISILLQFNEILEKILHTRVYAYLQEFNLLSNHQYAYRWKSATAFAVENIYPNL